MRTFNELKKNLKKDFSNFKIVKIAVLGDTATQFLIDALRGTGFEQNFHLDVWQADFNQIERQVFDPAVYTFGNNCSFRWYWCVWRVSYKYLLLLYLCSYYHFLEAPFLMIKSRYETKQIEPKVTPQAA